MDRAVAGYILEKRWHNIYQDEMVLEGWLQMVRNHYDIHFAEVGVTWADPNTWVCVFQFDLCHGTHTLEYRIIFNGWGLPQHMTMITSGGTFPLEVLYAVKLQCPLYTLKTMKTTNKYVIGIFLIFLLSYNTKKLGSINA